MLKKMGGENRELVRAHVVKQGLRAPSIIAGIPAYNEEKTIAEMVLKAGCHVGKVLVCDDGSKDMTRTVARENGADVLKHEKNMGYGATMQTLFRKAKELGADVLVAFDGDGQHDPDEIPSLVKPILEGRADLVIGSRFLKGAKMDIPLYRKIGVLFITLLTRIVSGYPISDAQSGFRAYSRRALKELKITELGWGSSVEVFFRARDVGLRIVEVPADCDYENYPKASKRDPLRQGISIVASILSHVIRKGVRL
jgi:glycosyltransferase involved in cell wall biosynthesis